MKTCLRRFSSRVLWLLFAFLCVNSLRAQTAPETNSVIAVIEGHVQLSRAGAQTWDEARERMPLFVGDRIRVGERSRLTLLLRDGSPARFDERSDFTIRAPKKPTATGGAINILKGVFFLFHRGEPSNIEIETQRASAAIRGTEFNLRAEEDGTTTVTVIDGEVELSNDAGAVTLKNMEEGVAEPGKAPTRRAALDTTGAIQWTFYYPGILDIDELDWGQADHEILKASLDAYRQGDLLHALSSYPADRKPQSDAEKVYLAALLLAVGQVQEVQALGTAVGGENSRLLQALREVIAAAQFKNVTTESEPTLATEGLARSYSQQAHGDLTKALASARQAVAKSPQFGFGWARVAELEFSFGRIDAAQRAIDKALQLSPRNAQALVVRGFLLAARNHTARAIAEFESAMAIDGGLANAWLGRGLSRIHSGDAAGGDSDLVVAAALEPQRAALRSYLGKAYAERRDRARAEHELGLAERLDPRDPTAWLYEALLKQQNNRINEAVDDLEKSQNLGGNRQLYRSQLLLDQDRAVRSANLAHIYRDAGMTDWSVREAGRAISEDYGNYSAHLFLANSYDQLRDPNRISLRYETPAESEYLIANLLAPVGAGPLSQSVSQGEYSKLFEANRFGVTSFTEYLSRGAWYENGAQFGVIGNTAYSVEGIYRNDPGQRPNNDFDERDLRLNVKEQLTHQDSIYIRATEYEARGGDLLQYYDQASANPFVRTRERQEPNLTLGYHHEWNPGMHTLLVGSRIDDKILINDPAQVLLLTDRTPDGLDYVEPMAVGRTSANQMTIYSGDAQQIWETPTHHTTIGLRAQGGDFKTDSQQANVSPNVLAFFRVGTVAEQHVDVRFERFSAYGYHAWQVADSMLVLGGLNYDRVVYPVNFRAPPITNSIRTLDQVSPKAGFVWTPLQDTSVRGAFSRALSGASLDQSLAIEPTQIAGFNQSFRSIIPESIAGSDAAAKFETYDLAIEHRFPTRTYVGITGEILFSENNRTLGAFEIDPAAFANPGSIVELLNYRERSLTVSLDQLLGRDWAVGGRYRLVSSDLDDRYPEVLPDPISFVVAPFQIQQHLKSTLHELDFRLAFNHPSGVFAKAETSWYAQSNSDSIGALAGDDFLHVNFLAGYRFLQRRAEVSIGLLNATDQDYKLYPLTPYLELPRSRTIVTRLKLAF